MAGGAATTADAATKQSFLFYGQSGTSQWNDTNSWKYNNGSNSGSWVTPTGIPDVFSYDVYFRSGMTAPGNKKTQYYNSDWDHVVTFSGTQKAGATQQPLHLDAGSTAENPIVFAATQSDYGLTSSSTLNIAETADGYLQINSGTYSFGRILLGNGSGKTGVLTMNGGTLNILNNYACLGCVGGTGILTVKTGAVFDNCEATGNGKNFTLGQNANSSGTLNVQGGTVKIGGFMALNYDADSKESHVNVTDGGVLEVNNLYLNNPGTSGGTLTIDGGTLKARADSSAFIGAHDDFNVYVSGNGATFDTAGYAITVAENLQSTGETAGGLAVTGEGSATFSAQGNLSGALTVGDGTTLHWFDQDGSVSASCGFTSLALGAGSKIYLNGDATGVDALPATATTTATAENKANVVIDFSAIPATGKLFTLFPAADADAFNVSPMFGSLVLPHEVAVVNGNLVLTISADNYTWNGTQTNWGDADAWTKGGASAAWADGNNAIFNTANATATLAADANPAKIDFNADATVNGSATLTVPVVSVVSSVAATITAPTSGALEKTGPGTLTLGSSRTDQTTLSEGTLKIASGATVDGTKLTLGTDAAKPVVFDYGGQTLTANPAQYLGAGMDVTLTNGMFACTSEPVLADANMPSTLIIAKDATLSTSERFVINTGTERTIKVDGGELDLTGLSSSKNNAWIMQNSSGTLRIDATNALLKACGYVFAGTGHGSAGLSPKLEWTVVDSTFAIAENGLFLGNRGNQPMSIYPVTPQVTFAMTNSVFYTEKEFILGQNPTENKSQTAGWYIADFDHCTVTSKSCRVYGDRPANAIRFNGVTLVSNGNGDSWIDAIGFADGATPVVVGADGLVMDDNGYAMTVTANLGGTGALKKTGSGKLTIAKSQTFTGALSCEAGETFVNAGLTVNRPATVKDGATLTVQATARSAFASLAFESGSTLNIDSYAVGVTAIAATALALPDSGMVALKFNDGAFPTGRYAILEKAGITAADVEGRLVPSVSAGAPSWEVSGDTLYLVVKGANDCIWTGSGGDARLGNADNWLGGNIPASGANVFIALAAAGEIACDIADFSPASITFQENSAAVTITGENAISAVVSVTNLSSNSHTIDVPVYFAGDIQVKQAAMAEVSDLAKAHVTFAGGAYAAQGYALENGNSAAVYSRCIFGRYYLANGENAPWTATVQGSGNRICLADNSTLYIPYAGALTELYISANAHVDVGKMALSDASRVSYRNYGEMAVTNLTLTGTRDRFMGWNMGSPVFKFERIETSMMNNWCYFADGNDVSSRGVYYIGAGGLNFTSASATGSYCIGRDVANDAQTIRPWDSDFTIGDRGNGAASLVLNRDVTFCTDDESGTGRTITMDAIARGYGTTPTVTVSGSGKLRVNKSAINTTEPSVAVTNTATLAFKPGAVFTTSEITVNSGAALQVAESGTVALGGGLTLKSGAALAFNYTGRDEPVLDLTGKTVTFDEGETTNVTVRISADAGARAHGGANVLTAGGKFADAKVALAEGAPGWVSGVAVENGEIVITVKPAGLAIFVK